MQARYYAAPSAGYAYGAYGGAAYSSGSATYVHGAYGGSAYHNYYTDTTYAHGPQGGAAYSHDGTGAAYGAHGGTASWSDGSGSAHSAYGGSAHGVMVPVPPKVRVVVQRVGVMVTEPQLSAGGRSASWHR